MNSSVDETIRLDATAQHHPKTKTSNTATKILEPVQDAIELFDSYEDIRDVLPVAQFPERYERLADLELLTTRYDAFFFDAFGVLNIGETVIEKAAGRVSSIRRAGREVRIVSNAGSVPVPALYEKYTRLGFDFSVREIISSRVALLHYLREQPTRLWGVIAPAGADLSDLGVDTVNLVERPDGFNDAEGFILIAASGWTERLHHRLTCSLQSHLRPVLLANPDLAAPRESGFSVEPGQIAHALRMATGCRVIGFGKPHKKIFDIALDSLESTPSRQRVLMIGDTLHTDVLGGCHAGLSTALVTAQGASAGMNWNAAIQHTGIVPHYVLDHI